jgi:HlyD family secretion protein
VAAAGDAVDRGSPVVTLEPVGQPLELVLFVPINKATGLRPGLGVQISPSGLSPSAFGYLKGTITNVGAFPATAAEMRQVLGTDELVRQFSASGPPVEVHVSLQPDSGTASGYKWSTPNGAPFPLTGGTFATAKTVLSTQHPFRLAF